MEEMTAAERKIVEEFKKRMISEATPKMLEDTSLFYRFAKARDYNLAEAEAMLKKHIIWRKENEIDTILTDYEPPEVLVKYAPATMLGFDKNGGVIRLIDCGRADAKGLVNVVPLSELLKYCAYIMEKDKDMLIKKGGNLGTPMYIPIYDFEGLSYANCVSIKCLQMLTSILKMFVDNFPETIKRIYVVNAPCFFTIVFSAMKQVLPKTVIQKFRVYCSDAWKKDLLEVIDAEVLPAYLGGTRTDPDGNPLCKTIVIYGQPIPKSYYKNKGIKKSSSAHDMKKLIVKPCSKEEITLDVTEANSHLEWEIELQGRDIDFSLLFREEAWKDYEPVTLIHKQRIEASNKPEKGSLKCGKAGSYTFVFDNTYSWLYSKEVHYRAEIKGPRKEKYSMQ